MKRLLFAFFILSLSVNLVAQEHLTFKGIPIDGTRKEFVAKLQEKGFTSLGTENDVTILQGDFAGNKDCLLFVTTLKGKDIVSRIAVMFPEKSTWSALEGQYFELKEMLTEKYGKPNDSIEEFQNCKPRDDNDKMYQVKFDRCNYASSFTTSKGDIGLMIGHDGITSCFVVLAYEDKINGDVVRADAMDDL